MGYFGEDRSLSILVGDGEYEYFGEDGEYHTRWCYSWTIGGEKWGWELVNMSVDFLVTLVEYVPQNKLSKAKQ
jgi:hypothetical protein